MDVPATPTRHASGAGSSERAVSPDKPPQDTLENNQELEKSRSNDSLPGEAGMRSPSPRFTPKETIKREKTQIETPKGPPLARQPTGVSEVFIAQYADVEVLELSVGEHVVMRRPADGNVNATQLLKLAGLDRSKRHKVLDREIGTNYEKVQGGTGKYQGTWVPLEAALELAKQYQVFGLLQPLLEFDVSAPLPTIRVPTQSELDDERRRLAQDRQNKGKRSVSEAETYEALKSGLGTAFEPPPPSTSDFAAAAAAAVADSVGSVPNLSERPPNPAIVRSPPSKSLPKPNSPPILSELEPKSPNQSILGNLTGDISANVSMTASVPQFDASTTIDSLNAPMLVDEICLPPLELDNHIGEQSRDAVTDMFLNSSQQVYESLNEIMAKRGIQMIEPDVPIDDAGHTALHWAAALGQLPLVMDLLQHGANCRRGNRKGESALIRAVLVTNSSDSQTFGELLNLLYPCLHLADLQGRTVLHHIALTAGIPGRMDASRYYLDALLEWAVRWRGSHGVKWLVDELVNLPDANGDTALNIAARLGSHHIAKQLVDVGASSQIVNRAGLGPQDFGMRFDENLLGGTVGYNLHHNAPNTLAGNSPHAINYASARAGSRSLANAEKREAMLAQCTQILSSFNSQVAQVFDAKNAMLANLHAQMRAASAERQNLADEHAMYLALRQSHEFFHKKAAILDVTIDKLNFEFSSDGTPPIVDTPLNKFDADEPFLVQDEIVNKLPFAILEARVRAYRQNAERLTKLRDTLRESSLTNEAKFRKVVAKCTSHDVNVVDDMLDDLLAAVTKGGGQKMDIDA